MASIEPWNIHSGITDSWISEAFARDTEALTKALQKSLYNTTSDSIAPFLSFINSDTTQTPTVSGFSGSDPEIAPKRQRINTVATGGKIVKRKSRASKKSRTTFIVADPANFRQMVQHVTGVRFGNSQMPVTPILKPEAQRAGGRLLQAGGFLPTLDTSTCLLDRQHQHQIGGPIMMAGTGGNGTLPFPATPVATGGASGFDFDKFSSFPTLESWKVL